MKKKINPILRGLLCIGLIGAMCLSLAACGGSGSSGNQDTAADSGAAPAGQESEAAPAPEADGTVYNLSWAGIGAVDSIDTWIGEEISARVAEQTDNHVLIKVYPANQLGDLTQAYDEIMIGSIDMGLFTVYGDYDIILESVFTPFLTTDLDQFARVYAKDGFLYQTMDEIQASRGVTLLGLWPSGYLGLGFAKLEEGPDELFDPYVKKAELLRVPSMDTMLASAQALGYNTTTINYSDVYTALQTGVCDGSWNGGAYNNYESFRDVLKYYVDYRVCNDVYSCIINTEKLKSMPQEYQDIIVQVSAEVVQEGTDMIGELDEQSLADLEEYGVEVIIPTDEQRESMRSYFIEEVWPTFAQYYGEDFIDQMIEAANS